MTKTEPSATLPKICASATARIGGVSKWPYHMPHTPRLQALSSTLRREAQPGLAGSGRSSALQDVFHLRLVQPVPVSFSLIEQMLSQSYFLDERPYVLWVFANQHQSGALFSLLGKYDSQVSGRRWFSFSGTGRCDHHWFHLAVHWSKFYIRTNRPILFRVQGFRLCHRNDIPAHPRAPAFLNAKMSTPRFFRLDTM